MRVLELYGRLLSEFGNQGWWPLQSNAGKKGFDSRGYHPCNFAFPVSESEKLEVCIGAILTQNTSWQNVEKAMAELHKANLVSLQKLADAKEEYLAQLIKSSGYFRQKAKKLKLFANHILKKHKSIKSFLKQKNLRNDLLSIWGVGPETADSIVLYAAKRPSFVIDAYTKRVFSRIGICQDDASYGELQSLFYHSLPCNHEMFNEYHALIVELAKRNCTKSRPKCFSCPANKLCSFHKKVSGSK